MFYHGTPATLRPGDVVHPSFGWAHVTTGPLVAATYALHHHGNDSGGHIYEVAPLDDVEQDARMGGVGATSSYRSRSGFQVVREYGRTPEQVYYGSLAESGE